MPVIAYNITQSIRLLSDSIVSFSTRCVEGITANEKKLQAYMEQSLMLVTALSPLVGYENAAKVAKKAFAEGISLKEATLDLHLCSPEEFEKYVVPANMI